MAGFLPAGSFPAASAPSGQQGIVYNITQGNAEAGGGTYTFSYTFPATRLAQLSIEVLHPGSPLGRLSQLSVEVLHPGTPQARLSQLSVEVLRTIATAQTDGGFVSILW